MTNLYIRLTDGQPFGNPLIEENVISSFPDLDLNNLPSNWARFERTPMPTVELGRFEVADTNEYRIVDGVAKEFWPIREMTEQERNQKTQNETFLHNLWLERAATSAQEQIDLASSEEIKGVWGNYLDWVTNFRFGDPFDIELPRPPTIVDGVIINIGTPGISTLT